MKAVVWLFTLMVSSALAFAMPANGQKNFDFYGTAIAVPEKVVVGHIEGDISQEKVLGFYQQLEAADYGQAITALLEYKKGHNADDWMFYQLIRRTAQVYSPKADDYIRYTLYKWYFLLKTGYNATLGLRNGELLLYVQCDDNIYDIPSYTNGKKRFVCLNYHDYGRIDFEKAPFTKLQFGEGEEKRSFSYKLTNLPSFRPEDYKRKSLNFDYYQNSYHFEVMVNEQLKNVFANYPLTDYQMYFDAPLSGETYSSLIPQLKKNLEGMSVKKGVDYLMRFTRYAFTYQADGDQFGKEKRMLPEQTLLYEYSDCEDRSALFFYLVKEIYNLPMIVLAYPKHVTVAVQFETPVGKPIIYNGNTYSVCEPTPQKKDLSIGELSKDLAKESYEVAYVYRP